MASYFIVQFKAEGWGEAPAEIVAGGIAEIDQGALPFAVDVGTGTLEAEIVEVGKPTGEILDGGYLAVDVGLEFHEADVATDRNPEADIVTVEYPTAEVH